MQAVHLKLPNRRMFFADWSIVWIAAISLPHFGNVLCCARAGQ